MRAALLDSTCEPLSVEFKPALRNKQQQQQQQPQQPPIEARRAEKEAKLGN